MPRNARIVSVKLEYLDPLKYLVEAHTHSPYVMDAMRYIAKFAALVCWKRTNLLVYKLEKT
jgi:hypothetical protein